MVGSKQMRVLVDTNIWVDQFIPQRPGQKHSLRFIDKACEEDVMLLYPACILKDVFYLIASESKRLTREKTGALSQQYALAAQAYAWGCIDAIQELALPVGTELIDIRMASVWRRVSGDFEDNLVRAAAERSEADLVVTWDKGMLSKRVVPTATPLDALAEIEAWKELAQLSHA